MLPVLLGPPAGTASCLHEGTVQAGRTEGGSGPKKVFSGRGRHGHKNWTVVALPLIIRLVSFFTNNNSVRRVPLLMASSCLISMSL